MREGEKHPNTRRIDEPGDRLRRFFKHRSAGSIDSIDRRIRVMHD
jgi:hypothetical protein